MQTSQVCLPSLAELNEFCPDFDPFPKFPPHNIINHLYSLDEHPLATTLDKLIQQHRQILQYESTDVECEEFGRMPSA